MDDTSELRIKMEDPLLRRELLGRQAGRRGLQDEAQVGSAGAWLTIVTDPHDRSRFPVPSPAAVLLCCCRVASLLISPNAAVFAFRVS